MNEDQIFIYEGEEHSKEQVLEAANQFGMTLEDYVVTHGLTVKKEAVVKGATAGPSTKAPVTDLNSAATSSAFPEFAEKPKPARAQTDIERDVRRGVRRGSNKVLVDNSGFEKSLKGLENLSPEGAATAKRVYEIIDKPLSPQELQHIEEQLEKTNQPKGTGMQGLVNMHQKTRPVGSLGPGSFTNIEQPKARFIYEDYTEAAKEQLRVDGGNPESPAAVSEIAKDLMRGKLTENLYKDKIDTVLKELEEEETAWQGVGDAFSGVLNFLSSYGGGIGAAGSGKTYDTNSSSESGYKRIREEVSGAIKATRDEHVKLAEQSAMRLQVSMAQMDVAQFRVESVKKTLDNAQTEEEYNTHLAIFNQELAELKAIYSVYEQDVDKIETALPWLTIGGMGVDLAMRSYNQADVFSSRFASFLLKTTAGVATFTETMAMKVMESKVPGMISPEIARHLYDTPAEQIEGVILPLAEWQDNEVRYRKQFLEVKSWQDFIDASVDVAGDQIGQLGLMAATGGTISSVIIGSSVAGQKMQDMNQQRKLGKQFTDAQYYGAALLYGVAEAGSEYITFKQLGRNINVLKKAFASGVITTDQLRASIYQNILTKGYDMFEEGGTEAISQFSQNLTDMYLLDDNSVKLFDGVAESFVSGAMVSLMMGVAPGAAVGAAKIFNTRSELEKVQANHNRILELQSEQAGLKEILESSKYALFFEGKLEELDESSERNAPRIDKLTKEYEAVTAAIEDLYMANVAMMYTGIDRIDKLTNAEKKEVLKLAKDITEQREKLRNAVIQQTYGELDEFKVGKTKDQVLASAERVHLATEELAFSEQELYDLMDVARDAKDKQRAWSAMADFALENNGIPSQLVSTQSPNWEGDLDGFLSGSKLYQYYKDNFGEDVADAVMAESKKLSSEIKANIGQENVYGSVTRGTQRVMVERDGKQVSVAVPMPRVIISKKGSWRHESAHLSLFHNLMEKGGEDIMLNISKTLTNAIAEFAKLNPEKYGALERYSSLRKKEYSVESTAKIKELLARKLALSNSPFSKKATIAQIKLIDETIKLHNAAVAEEHAISVIEYMASNNIKLNKNSGRSFVNSILEAAGMKNRVDFNNVNDVLHMFNNFNKRFDSGKTRVSLRSLDRIIGVPGATANTQLASGRIINFLDSFKLNLKNEISDRAIKMADKVNSLYLEKGLQSVFEIGNLYIGMINKALLSSKTLPNFNVYKEDIISEALYGNRGLIDLIKKFDPSRGVPLAAFLNKYIELRVHEAVTTILGAKPMFMSDVTELPMDSGENIDDRLDEILDYSDETATTHSVVRRKLGLTTKQMNRVRGSVLANLSYSQEVTESRKWVPSVFLSNLLDAFKTDLFSLLKGREESLFPKKDKEWFEFAEGMYEWIVDTSVIPLSTWMRHKVNVMYEESIDPVTNKQIRLTAAQGAVGRASDPLAGNRVWKPKNPTKEEFMQWIRAEGLNPKTGKPYSWTTVGTRKDMIATVLARHMALDAVMETLNNPKAEAFDVQTGESLGYTIDVFDKWETIKGETQNTISLTANIAYVINRDPNLLFNKKSKKPGAFNFFDLASEVMDRVNKNIKGGMASAADAMLASEGDFATQSKIADTYAREIILAMEQLATENVINPPSAGVQKQMIEEIFRIEFVAITKEGDKWTNILKAGMRGAEVRLAAQNEAAKAKSEQRKKGGKKAVAEMSAESRTTLEQLDQLDKKWNELMSDAFTGFPQRDISTATAQSVYDRKPWWKKIHSAMSPRAEDFLGLLYWTLGKGEKGNGMKAFYIKNILEPFNRASSGHDAMRVGIFTGFKTLNKTFKTLTSKFNVVVFRNIDGKTYTVEDVVKVKMWTKLGYNIPDISTLDLEQLLKFNFNNKDGGVSTTANLDLYVDGVLKLFKKQNGDTYAIEKPRESRGKIGGVRTSWDSVPLSSYVSATLNGDVRKQLMKPFSDKAEAIFTEHNLNKLEAIFGTPFVDSMKDMMEAMNSGRSPFIPKTRLQRGFDWWYNGSIGMIMFANLRSAVLQLVSTANYINWTDNNPLKMAQSIANPKEYAAAFAELMNSDFMVVRRNSGQIDVEMSEIEEMIREGNFGRSHAWMMKNGYLLTRYADSAAILLGGTSFYMNRMATYIKEGMSKEDAKNKAFDDFRELTETNQQSARQDKLSQEQRSKIGRIILAFGNTSMQYSRIMEKSAKDIINGRGDLKTNLSRIMYYGLVQNAMFTLVQQGMFKYWLDDDDEEDGMTQFTESSDMFKVLDSMFDNVSRGFGVYGAIGVAMKKTALKYNEKFSSDYTPKFGEERSFAVVKAASSISPALSYKMQKISDFTYNSSQRNRLIKETGGKGALQYEIEMFGTAAEFFANVPLRRFLTKYDNLCAAYQNEYAMTLRVANVLGWPDWQFDPEVSKARQRAKYEVNVDDNVTNESQEDKTRKALQNKDKNKEKQKSSADRTRELLKLNK